MNTHALSDAPTQPRAAAEPSATHRFYWLVRREILENRIIYLAPLAVVPLILLAYAIGLRKTIGDAAHLEQPYTSAALLLMFISVLVSLFYSVDALYGERRDRSILFWKSLPVSDLETVLAKASIPILVIPLVTFALTFATQVMMLLISGARLAGTGQSVWSNLSFGHMTWVLFCHLLIGHGFWFAPFWGWFLLASAWARRAPFLWATLPPLVIGLLERIAFHTSYFGLTLAYRFAGGPATGVGHNHSPMTIASVTPESWGSVFTSPGFWLGLVITAAFLAAAIRLRRDRGPI
jgi:ABC-2 type transport system permease protein